MALRSLVGPDQIYPGIEGFDAPTVLRALSQRLAAGGEVGDAESLYTKLWERERIGSTGIGHRVAVPHCRTSKVSDVVVALAHVDEPIEFGAVDGKPVRLFFVVVSPERRPAAHLQVLAAISQWVRDDRVDHLLRLDDPLEIHAALAAADDGADGEP